MYGTDMRGLIDRCNGLCTRALHAAAGMAVNRTHYEVTVDHLLLALLDESGSDFEAILRHAKAAPDTLRAAANRTLEELSQGNSGRPVFAPLLQESLEAGWLVASVELGQTRIRSGALLLALARRPSGYTQGDVAKFLRQLNAQSIQEAFATITADSSEGQEPAPETGTGQPATPGGQEGFIARFCEDFTAKAALGKLDPVFGRDEEIRQMVDILARRRKNNPILVGEPGVGKTAVMEGLALRITQGDVPDTLRGVTLVGLDMGLLEAGASMKGEFERRLKGVLDEVKGAPTPMILFIDEAHLLVGAGNAAGGSDAANLMKPALARGEIRTCAATTWKEYKKYFEKDPALARRFQLVKLDEPSAETTALILRGLRVSYERAHGVPIRDEALEAAAQLAARYITGRFLPDKAVDLLDTACARVKVGLAATPAPLEDAQRALQARERERTALQRDLADGAPIDPARLEALERDMESLRQRIDSLRTTWEQELAAAKAVIAARAELERSRATVPAGDATPTTPATPTSGPDAPAATPAATPTATSDTTPGATPAPSDPQNPASVTDSPLSSEDALARLNEARQALYALQNETPLLHVEVTADAVAKVVSDWTGIPVGKVARDQAGQIARLGETLRRRIEGQDAALDAVVQGIQASKAGLRAPEQPLGVFLLVGPSGVGKTETGLALADALFGDERSVITVNMSEFQEKHTVSRLIGSPPGYVGYGEGGLLTEAVRRKPYSVVLLDEVEKAHPEVMQLFYQVFDKGTLCDGEGTEVSFRNTVIMLTSNLGWETVQDLSAKAEAAGSDPAATLDLIAKALRPILSRHFQPALLARMTLAPYVSLSQQALQRIAALKLQALARRTQSNTRMALTWTEQVPATLAARCSEGETGARNIEYILAAQVLPELARRILAHMADGQTPKAVELGVDDTGGLYMDFTMPDAPCAASTTDERLTPASDAEAAPKTDPQADATPTATTPPHGDEA